MSTYFIGDIHGCYTQLCALLKKVSFNAQKDFLWVCGDLVSRGPDSIKVVRHLYALKKCVKIVLGNHDLNLIAIHAGIRKNKKRNCFEEFFQSDDGIQLIHWLRNQPVLQIDEERKIIMSHAGISPHWNIMTAKYCAESVETLLSNKNYSFFMESIYDNNIDYWPSIFSKLDRLKYSINVFTRMRYCYPDGRLNLSYKNAPCFAPYPLLPWFLINRQISKAYSIFFGHWSSLRGTRVHKPFYPLDTGCCWGNELTIMRWEDKKYFSELNKNNIF